MRTVRLSISLYIILITACSSTLPTSPILTPTTDVSPKQANQNAPILAPTEDYFTDIAIGHLPVIYSHGGGPCDIGGMVYFTKHPRVDLIGLVLSRGEFRPQLAAKTWPVFLYDVLNSKSTSVGIGTETSLDSNPHEFPEAWRGPSSNFWNLELPPQTTNTNAHVGHELIVDLVKNSPNRVVIVAMGAMTDVALALQQDPDIINNISQVVIMGGAFNVPGNLSDGPEPTNNTTAEWNMFIDATAAKYILDSGAPVSIVPLDAIQYFVNAGDIGEIKTIDDPGVEYVARMWDQQYGWGGDFLIWDTITATAVTNPGNFYWTVDGVDVITDPGDFQGRTVPLHNGAQNIRYATGANYEAIMDLLLTTFRGYKEGVQEPTTMSITGLGGTWEGKTTANFQIIFYLESECVVGLKCGTFEITEFSLTGDVTFVAVDGNIYEFRTSNLSYPMESQVVYESLQLLPDGTIRYFSLGENATNEGILYRK